MRAAAILLAVAVAAPATAQRPAAPSVAAAAPLFAEEMARTRRYVDGAIAAGIDVPVPKDAGGGFTHEQHKRNYQVLYGAGHLYRLTGERKYLAFSRDLLLAYAKLWPSLGPHPAKANEAAGRLFWQSLNDAVWLVYSVQGYAQIRGALTPADRRSIDDEVFRRAARFHAVENAATFDRIHNHATWACAGVGMTGYLLGDRALVDAALKGRDGSGRSGFLAQVDQLFSPDGYYNEGPYYQRYALQPFVMFAHAIAANDPGVSIWRRRDGVLVKAIRTTIQLTEGGYFFPLNDAMPDKGLKTDELYQAVAIGYGVTGDLALLSIARDQGRTVLTPEGEAVARDLAAGKARPFAFTSQLFRDGPAGDQGAVAVLRGGSATLVAKNSAMGMGHGHFDKLNWLFYDRGRPVVTDYGAARFLNVESKDGGRYLPENESWAKQTVAHNTLVVNERSHFDGKWREGEKHAPRQLFFGGDARTQISSAEMDGAYPGVRMRRTLALIQLGGGAGPLVVDLLKVASDKPVDFDLPLHYRGHITAVGAQMQSHTAERPVLGKANGYQHIWVDATAKLGADGAALTWMLGDRFYTYRMLPPEGAELVLGESGANDPRFNLRREPLLLERVRGASEATFVNLLESHGRYDASAETVVGSRSGIAALRREQTPDADLIIIKRIGGGTIVLAVADSADPAARHRAILDGRTIEWVGHWARADGGGAK